MKKKERNKEAEKASEKGGNLRKGFYKGDSLLNLGSMDGCVNLSSMWPGKKCMAGRDCNFVGSLITKMQPAT